MPWGAAIGAVGAIGSAYLNKKSSAGGSSSSESPEEKAASDQALSIGQTIANTPYQPYTGQVVAGMSANEQQGTSQASPESALNQKASSLYDQAAGDIAGIKQYNSDNIKSYMDPYVSATLTPALNAENINYASQRSALENSKAGAFGGDRSALQEQSLETSHSQQIAADVGNAYSKAYDNAQTAFFQDQNKQLNAAKALTDVGGDVSKLNTQQIQDLMATGGVQRALSQQQLNFNLNTFLTGQNWSTTQLQPLLQSIAASKGVQTSTQLYGPNSDVAGTAIGAAATVAGAYFTGGSKASSSGSTQPIQVSNNTYSPGDSSPSATVTENDGGTTTSWDDVSDHRLKTNLVQVGYLPSGLPWYEFEYIYDRGQVHQGVIAQEARLVFPDAVRMGEDGFLRVIYSRIH